MNNRKIFILKANGTREEFQSEKLANSLKNAGASLEVTDKIVRHIAGEIEDGMSSSKIYHHAFELLHKFERPVVARYSLKRAVMELGPTGFPFEKFVSEIFKAKGFETTNDQTLLGLCIDHEIDIVAWNENKLIMVEAKFHNELGLKSDLKVVLYVKARYDDLRGIMFSYGKKRPLDEGWLVTNTKFTDKAIRYSECTGVKLVGWNYPAKGNLHDLIEDASLHPITCLTTLSLGEKRVLAEKGIVLCKMLRENPDSLLNIGLDSKRIASITDEAKIFCPRS